MNTYTPPTREQIYQAFFALASSIQIGDPPADAFRTKSRRLKSWSQVAGEEKPAFYQLLGADSFKKDSSGMPYINKMGLELFLFVQQPDDNDLISPLLTSLVDAVVAALQPAAVDEQQTLGGLVYDVSIKAADHREGLMGNDAFTVMAIEISVAGLQPDH
jgi:hypothetical protein